MIKKYTLVFLTLFCAAYATANAQAGFYENLADSAMTLTKQKVVYDPAYFSIAYPNGDVPGGRGVCSDVIIRAYRKMGIDLQKEVHEDMKKHFSVYPKKWGLKTTDKNIDHRRVPNLMTYFSRHGEIKEITAKAADYQPGDIVAWDLGNGVTHIGIVSAKKAADGTPLIIHNIGAGQVIENVLFSYHKIIGHYRYSTPLPTCRHNRTAN